MGRGLGSLLCVFVLIMQGAVVVFRSDELTVSYLVLRVLFSFSFCC